MNKTIQANELRIGNKILNDGKIETVSEISNAGHIFTEESGFVNIDNHIEPIELTPEILEKAGFELRHIKLNGDSKIHYSDFKNVCIDYFRETCFIVGTHQGYEHENWIKIVRYVHELQNLYFALTGEELNISLT